MKRKIVAIMLVMLMLCPILVGCSGGESTENTESEATEKTTVRDTVTLTMWVVTEQETTAEAQEAVETAINVITKSTYTTSIDLIFYTKDEYEAKLNAKFNEIDARVANGASKTPPASQGEEYFINDLGVSELKYPDVYENQVDIVYIAGRDQLNDLVTAGRLMNLNDSLSSTGKAKILNDVIPQQFFTYTKMGSSGKDTYAVPNNRIAGDYTFLLVNKELVSGDANGDGVVTSDEIRGTYTNFTDILGFFDCEDVIEYVKNYKPDMIPILNDFDNPYIKYWSEDGSFSILASKTDPGLSYEDVTYINKLKPANAFGLTDFVNFELLMKKYEVEGYFAADAEAAMKEQNFGVAVIKGDNSVLETYGDKYYIKAISNPELDDSNLYTSFYGISSYTANYDRALEIIIMLNTNSEFRNTLQYGVEGVHYELNEDGRVVRLNKNYMMDIATTGNIFVAHLEEYMPDDEWERGVVSNLDIQVDPMAGFWKVESKISDDIYKKLAEFSKECYEGMEACQTVEELDSYIKQMRGKVNTSAIYKEAADQNNPSSIFSVYSKWYDEKWPVKNS